MGSNYDVVVVGGGNAGLCAALAAREGGAEVLVLERAPSAWRGGNTAFTAGAMRVVFDGLDDLVELMPDLSQAEIEQTDFGSYTSDRFFEDMARVTDYRTDPDLAAALITQSHQTLKWMTSNGVRFVPSYGRQAFEVDGRFTFWGGLAVETAGGGEGLVEGLTGACERGGIDIRYDSRAVEIVRGPNGVAGIEIDHGWERERIPTRAVVIASGGFEANAEWRTRYLGPGWDLAKVRGTRYNTGDGIRMGLDVGASSAGNWSGCHAVAWDLNAPEFGDLKVRDSFQKHSYPLGIVVNSRGERFLDEGADFRNYTYARYGAEILKQPGQRAWQVFDAKVEPLLRDEYHIREVSRFSADSLEELAAKLEGVDQGRLLATIDKYNAAVDTSVPFNPNVKDGRGTVGLEVPKSNWANPLDSPPYTAYAVTCGITFTFGGLRIEADGARVLDDSGDPVPGLYAAGEVVGGLFYFNYPGGTGLTSGSVFGRAAGTAAARDRL